MAIDPKLVKWDDEQPSAIDPKQVQWDAPTPATAPAEQNNFGMTNIKGTLRNVSNMLGGLLRGAGDIGATAVLPVDMVKQKARGDDFWSMKDNAERRDDMTSALQDLGVDTNSLNFRGGRLASNVMGTAGAGGLVAGGARAVLPAAVATRAAPVLSAIESGGMTAGTGGMATRMLGGGINGATSAALVNPEDAQTGGVVGAIFPTAAKIGGTAGTWVSDRLGGLAQTLMQSALKPSKKAQLSGDAERAIKTLLDNGVNVSKGGVEKLRALIDDANNQIADKIANSNATISKQNVLNALSDVKGKFSNQVNPVDDLSAINNVADQFSNHPFFDAAQNKINDLKNVLDTATLGKIQALQAAGKLKTFAAQQGNLAHGGEINLATRQPQNQLYFNSGDLGGSVQSSSAYPLKDLPRIPGRYTNNIDRVAEGNAGYQDAMAAYTARKADEQAAKDALAQALLLKDSLPVQIAQNLKQGTYRVLNGKYGQLGSAETEAQKGLARGLKNEIANAVPDVGALNARESDLINALNLTEARALQQANNNPMGIGGLAVDKSKLALMMLDKNAAIKSLLARSSNRAGKNIGFLSNQFGLLENPVLRAGLLSLETSP